MGQTGPVWCEEKRKEDTGCETIKSCSSDATTRGGKSKSLLKQVRLHTNELMLERHSVGIQHQRLKQHFLDSILDDKSGHHH